MDETTRKEQRRDRFLRKKKFNKAVNKNKLKSTRRKQTKLNSYLISQENEE